MGNISKVCSVLGYCHLFSFYLLQFCAAADTITTGQSITDGKILVSAQGNFTLGFFRPGSSQKRYVGIWFTKVSVKTVVWVANRENPLNDSSGVFMIRNNGILVVLDGRNNTLWSSTNVCSITTATYAAKLSDYGNLVLVQGIGDDSENILWQSFDHPSDTALPKMRIGSNLTTGVSIALTSWKDRDDPSPGNFTLRFDPNGLRQLFVLKGLTRYWRSGQWNRQIFVGVPEMTSTFLSGIDVVDQTYVTYLSSDRLSVSRFVMNWNGTVEQTTWNEQTKEWTVDWTKPFYQCEFYGYCGSNAQCNQNSSPVCDCLPGFEPRYAKEWASGNWSGGCRRTTQLQLKNSNTTESNGEDGFWKLSGIKLPDSSVWLSDVDEIAICEVECLKNSSCVAYAFVIGIGCMAWYENLIDIQKFYDGGEALCIRLAAVDLDKLHSNSKGKRQLVLIISIVCVFGTILFGTCAYCLWRWKLKQIDSHKERKVHEQLEPDMSTSVEVVEDILHEDLWEGILHRESPDLPLFDLGIIIDATDHFSSANKLGEGGFGPVYKGKLLTGQEIAVKRLSKCSTQGLEEFKNEIMLISKLQHRNLVRLLGYCIQGEEMLLLYEYMPNRSLDDFIFDQGKRALLDWRKCFHIIEGIARGLLYLHRDSRLKIIHRDLKASNILLDCDMNPKISDFGMARIFGGNQTYANTKRLMGTYGYMAPEYAMEGHFSEKSDVFSFGVLLLEIISGKKNTNFYLYDHPSNLLRFAWDLWNADKGLELMDPILRDSCSTHEVLRCIHVGLLCVQGSAANRPAMPFVVSALGTEIATLPAPKQLAFVLDRSPLNVDSTKNSASDVTITTIQGR